MSQVWDNLSPCWKLKLWPSTHLSGALTTELLENLLQDKSDHIYQVQTHTLHIARISNDKSI